MQKTLDEKVSKPRLRKDNDNEIENWMWRPVYYESGRHVEGSLSKRIIHEGIFEN